VLWQRGHLQSHPAGNGGELLDRKMKHIRSTSCQVVATGNPGCLLQILNGARQENIPLRVVHPVTLLAEAYRTESGAR